MKVDVRSLGGEVGSVYVSAEESVEQLKSKIPQDGVPANRLKLLLDGKMLENTATVSDSGIQDGSCLDLIVVVPLRLLQSAEAPQMRLLLDDGKGECRLAVLRNEDYVDEYNTWGREPYFHTFHMEVHNLLKGTFVMAGDTVVCTWSHHAEYMHLLDPPMSTEKFMPPASNWSAMADQASMKWGRLSIANFQQVEKVGESEILCKTDIGELQPSELGLGLFEAQKVDALKTLRI